MNRYDDDRGPSGREVGGEYDGARRIMVASQLRPSGVDDVRVVAAMAIVPREAFVPASRVSVAYSDRPVPLTATRAMNTPIITARLLTKLQLNASDRVLLIGAAGGYAAALLSRLVYETVAVEEDAELAAGARRALAGLDNVKLVEARLAAGHPEGATYDVVLIDGAVDRVPNAIVAQMVDGGRLAAGLIERDVRGDVTRLVTGRKAGDGFGTFAFEDGDAVRLPGFQRAPAFQF